MIPKYQIRNSIKARLLRKHRGGLIKKKTKAETAFEVMLKKLKLDYIYQAGFLCPTSFYIADFYIKSPFKLIIEIDDESHNKEKRKSRDIKKTSYFVKCGFKVLRFTNDMVLKRMSDVEQQFNSYLCTLKT